MGKIGKRTSVVAVFVAVIVAGGVAAAAWLVTGTGTASSQAASAVNLTVSAVTAPNEALVSLTGNGFGLSTSATTAPIDGEP